VQVIANVPAASHENPNPPNALTIGHIREFKTESIWLNFVRNLSQRISDTMQAKSMSGNSMNNYTAVLKNEGDAWIGWIEEVTGVNCQEPTREELIETLKTTLQEALDMNRMDARGAAQGEFEELQIAI